MGSEMCIRDRSNANGYTGNYKTPPSEATNSPYYSSGISVGGDPGQNNGAGNNYGGHGKVVLRWFL